jgi:hypothetical protein
MFTKSDIDAMQAIRYQIDPQELSNPGKMLPFEEKTD